MATVTFEAKSFKKTRFFTQNTAEVTNTSIQNITFATTATSNEMYTGEGTKEAQAVTVRSYEIYIDDDATVEGDPQAADANGVSGLARVTTDATKSTDTNYDIYVSDLPVVGAVLSDPTAKLSFQRTNDTGSKWFRLVFVTEEV